MVAVIVAVIASSKIVPCVDRGRFKGISDVLLWCRNDLWGYELTYQQEVQTLAKSTSAGVYVVDVEEERSFSGRDV